MKQKIGLIDVDSHHYPNFALMRTSAFHKAKGDSVEWAKIGLLGNHYDMVYKSKIFSFTTDIDDNGIQADIIQKGGTGYDIKGKLDSEIESSLLMDYEIYPQYNFSVQFFSRGCIRNCPFCVVRRKEGYIHPVDPVELNPKGEWIEVLDNNFFGNPEWRTSVDYLLKKGQKVNLHGVDVRLINEEQSFFLNKLKHKHQIKIAWDNPRQNILPYIANLLKYIKPYKIMCYVLVGYNSTMEEDLYRIYKLKELKITPYVMVYRDYDNKDGIKKTQYQTDIARWTNNVMLNKKFDFKDYSPRKGFTCSEYFKK